MERLALPLAILFYLFIAVVIPTLRVWRRSGVWPIVFHREATPAARAIGALFGLFLLGITLGSFLSWLLGPQPLGIIEIPGWATAMSWLLLVIGACLTLIAQKQMGDSWRVGIDDRPTVLITGGIFAWSRNPIFASMMVTMSGIIILMLSWWSVLGFLITVATTMVQVRLEERQLLSIHGATYAAYAGRVGRFLPGIGLIKAADEKGNGTCD